jgi:hypothetical protein
MLDKTAYKQVIQTKEKRYRQQEKIIKLYEMKA